MADLPDDSDDEKSNGFLLQRVFTLQRLSVFKSVIFKDKVPSASRKCKTPENGNFVQGLFEKQLCTKVGCAPDLLENFKTGKR